MRAEGSVRIPVESIKVIMKRRIRKTRAETAVAHRDSPRETDDRTVGPERSPSERTSDVRRLLDVYRETFEILSRK